MQQINTHPLFPIIECLRGMVFALVVLLLVQAFLIKGLLTPHVVSSCSMSPAFRGPHVELKCPECETAFCIETGHLPQVSPDELPLQWGTCPCCAFAQVPIFHDSFYRGDRIFVNRAAVSLPIIRRWDAVLFCTPHDGRPAVKRIVGLPGETLEIRNGDIYINGQIAVKPFAVQKQMRIPVPYGRWEMQPAEKPDLYELVWHPIHNVPHTKPFWGDVPDDASDEKKDDQTALSDGSQFGNVFYGVTNRLCENQWQAERAGNVFPVDDLMLEFDWWPEATRPLSLRVAKTATGESFEIALNPKQRTLTVFAGTTTWRYDIPRPDRSRPHKITVSFFDRLMLVVVDGKTLFEQPLLDNSVSISEKAASFVFFAPGSERFSQAEQQTAIQRQVENLCIWRDIYYTQPSNNNTACTDEMSRFSVTLPDDAYFLLGDNSDFSIDGRHWQRPFVTQRDLIGIVKKNR